ncbi:hypothetical protein [Bradyrhizobium sp. TM102]|uniref:hypothetical protein n=1 Tax=Bradyrhizobium sp. TM102 TaxID=2599819 RepID=UPI0012610B05|nr:hypothetical protein [Bradyrhizobium sp. TM102]BBO09506.1 hypothetical protein TM102_09760 [Bradyrhizobium sp. TM102]
MLRPNDPAPATNPTLPSVSRRFSFAAPQLRERYLIGALSVLTLSALLAPALPAAAWHVPHFVDSRTWLGVPNAGDVLSNLAFLAMGVWGSERLRARHDAPVGASWLFVGLILTCLGSGFYHLDPDMPQRLVADRLGMAVAFAGFLGIAASERISVRAGEAVLVLMMMAGLLAAWVARENLTPWVVVQFGGMALAVGLALTRPRPGALGVPLGGVIFFYVLAKLFELGDALIFEATGHVVSGHTLKHLAAALAAWPVISTLRNRSEPAAVRSAVR